MLREIIERSLKLARRRAEPYKNATEQTHNFHGGFSKGYHEGKIAAFESILDELDNELSLIQIAADKATRCDELFAELERVAPDSPLLEKIRNEQGG